MLPTKRELHIVIIALILYTVVTDIVQYSTTEAIYLFDNISEIAKTAILFGSLLLTAMAFAHLPWISKRVKTTPLILLFLATSFIHREYSDYYSYLQTFPKIKSVSKNWTIQGDRVAIFGKNFGARSENSGVEVDTIKYGIVTWTSNRIVTEQPVPDNFFVGTLKVTNHHNRTAEYENFEIKDPSKL